MPKAKNKRQEELQKLLFPIHKNQWKRAYKKLIIKISGLKSKYKVDIEDKILEAYGKPCPYCGKRMSMVKSEQFSVDHVNPTSRGGENCLENMEIICTRDNRSKGVLNKQEYQSILDLINNFEPEAKQYVKSKLGAKLVYFNKK